MNNRWQKVVGQVFNTQPRDGSRKDSLWVKRGGAEETLTLLLQNPGVHICVDGPTGSGKSSLAITVLNRFRINYNLIQMTSSMTWQDFCRELIDSGSNEEISCSTKFVIGLKNGLPTFMLEREAGSQERQADNIDLAYKMSERANEHDICKSLAIHNILLFIDDFERAKPELATRIADMCKLLTQSYQNIYSKILVVGTDDICRRLYAANASLEGRLEQISVGTFAGPGESWQLLSQGFDKLDIRHPGNSKFPRERELIKDCTRAVYEAADGLPKSLNQLGRSISIKAQDRPGVTASDILATAEEQFIKALRSQGRKFRPILKCINESIVVQEIIGYLYKEGIGKIHNLSEISMALMGEFGEQQIEQAVKELVQLNFLVRTGEQDDILFTTQPEFAHIFGLIISRTSIYMGKPYVQKFMGQLTPQLVLPL
jgi:hypothetical protein